MPEKIPEDQKKEINKGPNTISSIKTTQLPTIVLNILLYLFILYNLLFRFNYHLIHPILSRRKCIQQDCRLHQTLFWFPGIEQHSYSLKMGRWRQHGEKSFA